MVSKCEAFEITRERVRERLLSRPVCCDKRAEVVGAPARHVAEVVNNESYLRSLCHVPEQVVRSLGGVAVCGPSLAKDFTHREQAINLKRNERKLDGDYLSKEKFRKKQLLTKIPLKFAQKSKGNISFRSNPDVTVNSENKMDTGKINKTARAFEIDYHSNMQYKRAFPSNIQVSNIINFIKKRCPTMVTVSYDSRFPRCGAPPTTPAPTPTIPPNMSTAATAYTANAISASKYNNNNNSISAEFKTNSTCCKGIQIESLHGPRPLGQTEYGLVTSRSDGVPFPSTNSVWHDSSRTRPVHLYREVSPLHSFIGSPVAPPPSPPTPTTPPPHHYYEYGIADLRNLRRPPTFNLPQKLQRKSRQNKEKQPLIRTTWIIPDFASKEIKKEKYRINPRRRKQRVLSPVGEYYPYSGTRVLIKTGLINQMLHLADCRDTGTIKETEFTTAAASLITREMHPPSSMANTSNATGRKMERRRWQPIGTSIAAPPAAEKQEDVERSFSPDYYIVRHGPENSKLSFFGDETAAVNLPAPVQEPHDFDDPYAGFEHRKIRNLRKHRQK